MTLSSSIWAGSGSCTSTPSTAASRFSPSTTESSSASETVSGSATSRLSIPTYSHALTFPRTYDWLAGFSPTMITARHGTRPYCSFNAAILPFSASFTSSDTFFPSIS